MLASRAASEPLEVFAERAGRALACAFSSSEEFEAAVIAERRAEGRYGPRHNRTQKLVAVAGMMAGIMTLAILAVLSL
jgi:hypothetical protein